jgi:formylmethanofuran dehydrogenase subunit E
MSYDQKVTEEIEEYEYKCNLHGELDLEDLALSHTGKILCEMCSVNAEMQPNENIDPSIKVIF